MKLAVVSFIFVASFLALVFPILQAQSATDWWTMYNHDPTHSGYSTSTAPDSNQTLWNYTTGDRVWSSPAVLLVFCFTTSFQTKPDADAKKQPAAICLGR